jgi:hypothetical protein
VTEYSDHPIDIERPAIVGLLETCSTSRTIPFDVSRYLHFIDDPSLSEDQKRQMAEALWVIVIGFVDLGFGIHPAQQACGKLEEPLANKAGTDSDDGKVTAYSLTKTFNKAAGSARLRKR